MKSNPRSTIISRNTHASLSREYHFSNQSAKRDQYSPEIIRSLQNWLNFRFGICGHHCFRLDRWCGIMRSTKQFLLRYCRLVFSRLNPLKPRQNQARLRPDGNKPRMPNDTDLTPVSAHRCKLKSSRARCPEICLSHFR